MITSAVAQFAVGFLTIVCGWFPKQPAVDQVVVTAGGFLQPIVDGAASLGVVPGRVTFVIDRGGVIRHVFSSMLNVGPHIEDALRVVRELQTAG